MESWRPEVGERPKVISAANLRNAALIHLALFLFFYIVASARNWFKSDEEIIPIELTVVVNENLDGVEDEPPPLDEPPPPPPPQPKAKPKPKPKPKAEPPKPLDQVVTNFVKKIEKNEKKKPEPEKPEKKVEETKKEPPKKTARELREERIRRMRESAKKTNKKPEIIVRNQPSGNGRTDKKTLSNAEIQKLLNAGYKPGKSTQLATSDAQLGYSLIKQAFEAKWDKPPWTDTLKPMIIRVWFGAGGRIVNYKLESSSGDSRADQTIKSAASRVGTVIGLPAAFIDHYKSSGVPVRFTVTPH